jgi:PPP family 3-phenylpropionic acid transporter
MTRGRVATAKHCICLTFNIPLWTSRTAATMRRPLSDSPSPTTHPSILRPAVVYFALFGAVAAYFPYISVYYRAIGLSLPEIGLLAALNAGVAVIAAPAWGALVDRARDVRGPIAVAGLWSAAAATWLAVTREPLLVGIAVAILAAGSAGLGPMLDSRTIEIVGSNRDRYGRARAFGSLAFTIGALGVGLLIGQTGPQGLFLVYVPGLILTSLAAFILLGRPKGGPERTGPGRRIVSTGFASGLAGLLRDPTLLLFFAGSVLLWIAVSAVHTILSVHLVQHGASSANGGLVWTPGALVEVPLMLAFPLLVRRIGAERLLVLGGLAFAARAGLWALTSDPLLFVAIAPLGGIGYALFYVGTVTYVSRAVPPSVQATAQGLFSGTAFSIGSILGSVIGGQLADALTIPGMFAVSAAGTAAGAGIVLWATEARKTALRG